jgi:hypothetical protein
MNKKIKILLVVCVYFITHNSYSQKLTTTKASWIEKGVCIERSIGNFIKIHTMSMGDFESQMKALGAYIKIKENFCIQAAEQLSSSGRISDECFLFLKCEDGVQIIWYGPEIASGFKKFMVQLQPYYIGTQDNIKGYGVAIGENKYLLSLERKRLNANSMIETLQITKKN